MGMCTAISFGSKKHYFGRNLDLEYSYNEKVIIVPRKYKLKFRKSEELDRHYAFIGMATVMDNTPLFYDATNEKGLSIAGLSFENNSVYFNCKNNADNIASFEVIPWIMAKAADLKEAVRLLKRLNIVNVNFNNDIAFTPLHFIISDKNGAITVESVKEGLKIYENNVRVLTNSPTFDFQITNLNNYMALSNNFPKNNFSKELDLRAYSRGMGALSLPGDFSSVSRFVKAAFVLHNSVEERAEIKNISQVFHILNSVAVPKGTVMTKDKKYTKTIYSSCCTGESGVYYYKTYISERVFSVNMYKEDINGNSFIAYPLKDKFDIKNLN